MAHACDTKSRTETDLEMKAICFKQIVSFLIRHPDWSDTAHRQHVLSIYGRLGATSELFDAAKLWIKQHK